MAVRDATKLILVCAAGATTGPDGIQSDWHSRSTKQRERGPADANRFSLCPANGMRTRLRPLPRLFGT